MSSTEGETTILTLASSKSRSLRTTVPISIVKQFRLRQGDKLSWEMKAIQNEIVIIIKPMQQGDKKL